MDHHTNDTDLKAMSDLRKWNLRHPGIVKIRTMRLLTLKKFTPSQRMRIRQEWLRLGGKP